ncbi:MAG: DUF3276 family protein [Spirochaetota bacterium]
MGIRGELYSARFASEGRTYFFNVKQNRNGDVFLSIVESKQGEGETFDRRSIVVFADQMDGFLKSFENVLKFIEKTGIKVSPDPSAYNRFDEDDRDAPAPRRRTEAPTRRSDAPARKSEGSGRRESFHSGHEGRPERPERFGRAERPARAEGPARAERPDRAERPKRQPSGDDKPVRRIVVRKPRSSEGRD